MTPRPPHSSPGPLPPETATFLRGMAWGALLMGVLITFFFLILESML